MMIYLDANSYPQATSMRNPTPLDGDTWFVNFITHRSVQSVFSRRALKLTHHRQ